MANSINSLFGITDITNPTSTWDPNRVAQTINGVSYNAFGDPINSAVPLVGQQGSQIPNYNYSTSTYNSPTTSTVKTSPTGTQVSNPNPQPSQPSQEDQARNAYFSYLDNAAGQLSQTKSELENQIGSMVNSSTSSINTSLNNALGDLSLSRQNVETNRATSLRDLEQNMRNQMTAGQRYLGSIPGASNSTATGMYNYALGKLGNQNRSNLQQQANTLFSNIDNQVAKVKSTAQDQMQQLYSWRDSQLSSIAQYIQQQRGNIDLQKAQYIQGQLAKVDTEMAQYRQAISSWAVYNSNSLQQLQQNLSSWSTNQPTNITQPSFPAMSFGNTSQNTGTNLYGTTTKKYDAYGNVIS